MTGGSGIYYHIHSILIYIALCLIRCGHGRSLPILERCQWTGLTGRASFAPDVSFLSSVTVHEIKSKLLYRCVQPYKIYTRYAQDYRIVFLPVITIACHMMIMMFVISDSDFQGLWSVWTWIRHLPLPARWKFHLALIQLLMIISQQNLAHATTAQLSCHVPNIVAITLLVFGWEQNEMSITFELWWKNC